MKRGFKLASMGLALALLFGGSIVSTTKVSAQDSTSESKRKIKSKVLPEYPSIARQLNLVGKVKLETAVAADGHVTGTKVLGGNPVLAIAAQDAVKKWRFEPAPKDTTEVIEVDFSGRN